MTNAGVPVALARYEVGWVAGSGTSSAVAAHSTYKSQLPFMIYLLYNFMDRT